MIFFYWKPSTFSTLLYHVTETDAHAHTHTHPLAAEHTLWVQQWIWVFGHLKSHSLPSKPSLSSWRGKVCTRLDRSNAAIWEETQEVRRPGVAQPGVCEREHKGNEVVEKQEREPSLLGVQDWVYDGWEKKAISESAGRQEELGRCVILSCDFTVIPFK